MLYPSVDLSDVNKVFARGIELTKEAVLLELIASGADNGLLDSVEKWSSPPFLVDADLLREKVKRAAVETSYRRYYRWRTKLNKRIRLLLCFGWHY